MTTDQILDCVIEAPEAAELLDLKISRVGQLARAGKLPGRRLRGGWVFWRPVVARIAKTRRKWGRPPEC